MNFEVAFEEWKIYASKRHKKQSFDTLTKKFFKFILPYFKGKDIFSITKVDYINWQNTILEFNFKNSYNQLLHSCFCQFLSFCQLYYDLDLNVAKIVGGFPKHNEEKNTDYYTLKEFKTFIKCVDNVVYKQFFTLLFFTGLRPSEAMALRFIDLENGFLYVRHNIQRKGKRLLDTPKNSSSIRKIMLDRKLFRDLMKLKKVYFASYNNFNDNFFVFGGEKPLAPTSIDRYKKKACDKANLRPITQHQFRHSHATLLVDKGFPITVVSKRLGHSKISTTLDYYVHNSSANEKRVVATLNFLRF